MPHENDMSWVKKLRENDDQTENESTNEGPEQEQESLCCDCCTFFICFFFGPSIND